EPPYPTVVTVAGIAWIVFGGLIVVNLLILLVFVSGAAGGMAKEEALTLGGGLGVLMAIFAAGFIFVGVQSVRGTGAGTIGNGIGSIVFGLMNFLPLASLLHRENYLQVGISFLFALALIAAGVLALVGTSDYKTWRNYQKRRERREDRGRGYRRRREELEEDALPRRRRREEPEEEEDDL